MTNEELRQQAMNAVANYLHYELMDKGLPENMMPFMKSQASELLDVCDRAIEKTLVEGKRLGVIKVKL